VKMSELEQLRQEAETLRKKMRDARMDVCDTSLAEVSRVIIASSL
jgi:hypothetical protein